MLKFLAKAFIKDSENVKDPKVRSAYGMLCGIYSIVLNLLMFVGKVLAGSLSGSVAIIADAFNSLSDAGSSIISMLGFALAGKKPDKNHPFGHGRIEYLTGLLISLIIIVVGVELLRSSVMKIFSPIPIEAGLVPALILLCSILLKFYMGIYNKNIGRKINSASMQASATDSISDSVSTAIVLISMAVYYFFRINIDAYAGILVSGFIIYGGITSAGSTISPLLGQPPEPELVDGIEAVILSHPEFLGLHDLIIHDYGPGRLMVSLHAEVDGSGDIFHLHDVIDTVENEIEEKFGCLTTIHMDPLDTSDENVSFMSRAVAEKLKELNCAVTIHDFRMVPGDSHTNLIFDAVFPIDCRDNDDELKSQISELIHKSWPQYNAVVRIDRSYIL